MRLSLFVSVYNLGNFLRRLVLPESAGHWSLLSSQTKLTNAGAGIIHHARRTIFQMAEVAVPKELCARILQHIWALSSGRG